MSPEKKKKKLAELFNKDKNKMINFVSKYFNNAADRDSEDIVQDVMLNMFNMSDITVPIDKLSSYVYRSLKNRAIDLLRKKNVNEISLETSVSNEGLTSLKDLIHDIRDETSNEFERKEIQENLFNAIDSLEESERSIIIMTEFEGKSFKEISLEMDVPMGTLLSRKSRSLKKIRNILDKTIHYGG